jgi:putative holliday junction resolvase
VLREREVGGLVIGWPLNMDGSEGPRCQAVRAFAARLDAELGLPMLLWDERLSTFAAEEAAVQAALRDTKRAAMLDALAAAAVLQDALDALARSVNQAAPERPRRT